MWTFVWCGRDLPILLSTVIVPGPGGLYLPQNEPNIWPMESNIGVIWTTKSDCLTWWREHPIFVRNHFWGSRRPLNEIPQVHPLSCSGVIKCVLRDRLHLISTKLCCALPKCTLVQNYMVSLDLCARCQPQKYYTNIFWTWIRLIF